MALNIPALNNQDSAGSVEVTEAIFGQEYNETLVHQLITKYLAGARQGTKAQKTRAEVSGGGAKPWRQKGTGRARSGTTRSPIWRTGGVTFAAKPRSFDQKLNRKMFRVGVRSILSELIRQNRLVVSNDILPSTPKTKELVAKLKDLDCRKILIVTDEIDFNLALSARNIPNVDVISSENINPVSLIAADKVIITSKALQQLEERLA
ncbi:MAG: 50S ribosomal protein L4 [Methylicorpusculum sp.]|uniref:50S ribosomal protein L4 n=2 Tax=Methylicorpusculum sp. TaxID=2713644 RepID=UPI00271F466B|nr:50S ribosomal protein L4 [Methylicorpusculum sp.]MDO8846476.1 50S ribosomal protein L4 [Methylicorpusculum sp.]MDO8939914.1 50S ribosomal protein L4 [Methylicorpusculum sp.]MDO9238992.1 50S ribosomal protein L4 [Methylicorpusculum sp.]MDP2180489.1 50S ribosomal protein L4 [Methylicorpusculum sp.]MDP2201300.1 50S ribosomal protein L4 [Methylicorpusculum sp.]